MPLLRLAAPTCALALLAAAACRHGAPPPAPADPWQRLDVPGAPVPVYAYPEPIERYAPDDRGAYVVRVAPGDDGAAVARDLGASDDIVGDDGYVVRLTAAEQTALAARPGVTGIAVLQPGDRRSMLLRLTTADTGTGAGTEARTEARIDLFGDATAGEVTAVAAWVAWRGGEVLWQGRLALRVHLAREQLHEASRLSLVRWIE